MVTVLPWPHIFLHSGGVGCGNAVLIGGELIISLSSSERRWDALYCSVAVLQAGENCVLTNSRINVHH